MTTDKSPIESSTLYRIWGPRDQKGKRNELGTKFLKPKAVSELLRLGYKVRKATFKL